MPFHCAATVHDEWEYSQPGAIMRMAIGKVAGRTCLAKASSSALMSMTGFLAAHVICQSILTQLSTSSNLIGWKANPQLTRNFPVLSLHGHASAQYAENVLVWSGGVTPVGSHHSRGASAGRDNQSRKGAASPQLDHWTLAVDS